MDARTWQTSGPAVSRLGLGLAALGRPGYINLGHAHDVSSQHLPEQMQARTVEMLDLAWQQGITYFDAARSYGRAEEFLRHWLDLRSLRREQLTIGSKWGYTYTGDWQIQAEHHEIKQHDRATLDRQWAETRGWLGEHVSLYQIHSATLESGVLENQAVLERLFELKQQGVLIGLSVSGPQQRDVIERALKVQQSGTALFDAVQATWNLLEQSAGPALATAHAAGWKVIIKEGLANGRLTSRNPFPAEAPLIAELQQQADARQVGLDAIALAAVLAQPWADVVLSGAATPAHLLSNLEAFQVTDLPLPWISSWAQAPSTYWQTRSQLQWN